MRRLGHRSRYPARALDHGPDHRRPLVIYVGFCVVIVLACNPVIPDCVREALQIGTRHWSLGWQAADGYNEAAGRVACCPRKRPWKSVCDASSGSGARSTSGWADILARPRNTRPFGGAASDVVEIPSIGLAQAGFEVEPRRPA